MSDMCCHKFRISGTFMPRYKACKNKASVQVDGMHYCGTHNPIARKSRQVDRDKVRNVAWKKRMDAARLSAAAPELLEALKECAAQLEIHMVHTEDLIAHMKAVSAIAKATGESA